MLEVKCDTEDHMLRTSEVQSSYPRFLFDHLAELLEYERNRRGRKRKRGMSLIDFY